MQPLLLWKSNKYYILQKSVYEDFGFHDAMCTLCTAICDLSGSNILFHIISSMHSGPEYLKTWPKIDFMK